LKITQPRLLPYPEPFAPFEAFEAFAFSPFSLLTSQKRTSHFTEIELNYQMCKRFKRCNTGLNKLSVII